MYGIEGNPILQKNIINCLNKPKTRKQLCKELNKPRTTIYDNLISLQKRKIVEKFSKNNGKRGRPLVYWRICGNQIKKPAQEWCKICKNKNSKLVCIFCNSAYDYEYLRTKPTGWKPIDNIDEING